ncbi:MAG: hypothetical protein LBJ96_03175 [Holosporaceae bacterium]|jgi:hypothetical protein|nr:hypothetical protein [Holosporaceae bacterium]
MRFLLTFSTLLFVFNLCAEHISDTDKPEETEDSFNSSVSDFEGGYCGLGINIGIRKTSAAGGVFTVGYQKMLCGNFFIGAEVGADFGSGSKHLRVGGQLNENSAGFEYLQRQNALTQIVSSYFRNLNWYSFIPEPGNNPSINGEVWRNFLRCNRYLGGSNQPELANPDGTPGPNISAFLTGNYSRLYVVNGNNAAATYSSFVGDPTINSVSALGGGNILLAMREIRNFIVANNPDLGNTLRSIGEDAIGGSAGTEITGAADANISAARQLAYLFLGARFFFYQDIGITAADFAALFGGDMNRVYDAIQWALSNNSFQYANIKTKASFNCSPYTALRLGYFFNELHSCLYFKVGIIQLNGRISVVGDNYSVRENNFNKLTPLFAIGFSKNINANYRINFEVSHTLKTGKNIEILTPYGHSIKSRTDIRKSSLAVIITYKF